MPPPQNYIERALKLQQLYCCRYQHNENGASLVNNCECEAESEYTMWTAPTWQSITDGLWEQKRIERNFNWGNQAYFYWIASTLEQQKTHENENGVKEAPTSINLMIQQTWFWVFCFWDFRELVLATNNSLKCLRLSNICEFHPGGDFHFRKSQVYNILYDHQHSEQKIMNDTYFGLVSWKLMLQTDKDKQGGKLAPATMLGKYESCRFVFQTLNNV